jgi:short-subunit dehydrogenase
MKKTALVTGATSGIGYELAKIFAREGYDLVLVSRSGQKLEEVKKELEAAFSVRAKTIAKDLSVESSPKEIYDELERENISISVLVNNAGFGDYGKFYEQDQNSQLNLIRLNISGLTYLKRVFHSRFPARPFFCCLLCQQGLCAFPKRGPQKRGKKFGSYCNLFVPRPYKNRFL